MKFDTKDFEARMKKSVESYVKSLAVLRVGRANPDVLSRVTIDYYGTPTPINQVAELKVADARTLIINSWDKSQLKAIEKAILVSPDLGLNPQNDGSCIRIIFPAMTEETRRAMAKQVAKMGEDAKVAVRNIRRDANDAVKAGKKNGDLTEDDVKSADKQVQELTDKYIKEIDAITAAKDREIMEI